MEFTCCRCKQTKPATTEFFRRGRQPNSVRSPCRECHKAEMARRRAENPEAHRASNNRYNERNREKRREAERRRSKEKREFRILQKREHYRRNRDAILAKLRTPAERARANAGQNARRQKNPQYRLRNIFNARFHSTLAGKTSPEIFHKRFGYTLAELMRHLERQFDRHMTWDNHGTYWEIDHIVPVSSFDLPGEFRACWALTNLRPLRKELNRSKSARRFHLV